MATNRDEGRGWGFPADDNTVSGPFSSEISSEGGSSGSIKAGVKVFGKKIGFIARAGSGCVSSDERSGDGTVRVWLILGSGV
jgi:hypothetical protein